MSSHSAVAAEEAAARQHTEVAEVAERLLYLEFSQQAFLDLLHQ